MLTGVLCVVLTPLVHRARRAAPPRAITMAAILIGLAPLVLLVVLTVMK